MLPRTDPYCQIHGMLVDKFLVFEDFNSFPWLVVGCINVVDDLQLHPGSLSSYIQTPGFRKA